MNRGDLVKITRGGIGVPEGALGLILDKKDNGSGLTYFVIWLCRARRSIVRRMSCDLELINASG